MDYLIVVERTSTGYSAFAPDLPGCVATGPTPELVRVQMRGAMEFHIEGMLQEGLPVPYPTSEAVFFELAESGTVSGQHPIEVIHDIKTFAAKAGITPSTARVYAHRYGIGRKMGRGWVFTDKDVETVRQRRG